jgi:hypothetical protein
MLEAKIIDCMLELIEALKGSNTGHDGNNIDHEHKLFDKVDENAIETVANELRAIKEEYKL